MILGEAVAGLDRGDELDRDEMGALVEQLEDGMLRVGADAAPDDRRRRGPPGCRRAGTLLPFDSISSCWR